MWLVALVTLAMAALTGCGGDRQASESESLQSSAAGEQEPSSSEGGAPEVEESQLQEGYSLLYQGVAGLQHVDKAFLVKFEKDRVQDIVTAVSDFADELTDELDSWAEAGAIRTDLDPLPEMEKRKLAAVRKARLISFAPVVGRTGANWQRTLLLSQSGALNQLRHLTRVMAEAEPDEARGSRLAEVAETLDGHYDRVVVALNDLYFCHDDPEPSLEEGN